jgi:hypothetical protein
MDSSFRLSEEERQLRSRLERRVSSAFYQAGRALEQIQRQKLYRSTHSSFESYCLDTFNFTRDYAYLKIAAASVYQNLLDNLPTKDEQQVVLPTKQGQLRPIVKASLRSLEQVLIWNNAVSIAGGRVPTASIVAEAVKSYLRKEQTPNNPFTIGEVCRIVARDEAALRKHHGCWCLVGSLRDWECVVDTWDTQLVVPVENLESWGLDEEQYQQIEELGVRMTRLYETGFLDDAAYWVLNGLAKLDRFYLSSVEEKLLLVLEREYLGKNP